MSGYRNYVPIVVIKSVLEENCGSSEDLKTVARKILDTCKSDIEGYVFADKAFSMLDDQEGADVLVTMLAMTAKPKELLQK